MHAGGQGFESPQLHQAVSGVAKSGCLGWQTCLRDPLLISGAKAVPATAVNHSLHNLLKIYLQYHSIEGSTEATLRFYREQVGAFLKYLAAQGHSMELQDVTLFDVVGYLQEGKDRGLSPTTIHTKRKAIHAWFNWMVNWEVATSNPVSRIAPPKLPKVRKPFLAEAHFHQLLDLCPLGTLVGSRRAAMLWLLATTGMRRRELLMLTVDDLDWERGIIKVVYGKGQKERNVPFLREVQRPMMWYLQHRSDPLPNLWVTERGMPLGYRGVSQDLERLFERAGVQVKDHCHIFRRTFAAHAVRNGVPRQYTQAVAGWSSPHMLDRYTAAMEAEEGAIEAFKAFKPFGG